MIDSIIYAMKDFLKKEYAMSSLSRQNDSGLTILMRKQYRFLGLGIMILGLGLSLSLASCSTNEAPSDDQPEAPVPESPVPEEPVDNSQAMEPDDMAPGDMTVAPDPADFAAIDLATLPEDVSRTGVDPDGVALAAFGLREGLATDGGEGAEQTVDLYFDEDTTVVLITQMGLLDDSVRGMRYFVELEPVPDSDQWEMVWAGRQSICYPGRGAQDWSSDLCL
jgi:hypothetical protein